MTTSTLTLLLVLVSAHQAPSRAGSRASLARLPQRLAHDFARLGAAPSIGAFGGGGAAALAVRPADPRVVRSLSSASRVETALDGGSIAGGTPVQFGIAGGLYALGLLAHSESTAGIGIDLVESQIVQSLITQGLKHAVGRARPDGGHNGFPSGHTATAFVTADVIARRFGWRAGAAAYLAAAYVGASRIAERHHYPSDVVFGAAIGIASARTLSIPSRGAAISASAAPLAGGAAVLVAVRPRR